MGRKRKNLYQLQEALDKPWCYYCERDFNDLLNLSRHQKAKHFKCENCGRRLNTAGGLTVHMQQVHKETLQKIENALEHRQSADIEIFGMEGIPQELLDQRKQRVIREFEAAAEAKRRLTGNPLPGMPVQHRPPITYETTEQMLKRLEKYVSERREGRIQSQAPPQPAPQQGQQPGNAFNQYASSAPFNAPDVDSFGQYPPPGVPLSGPAFGSAQNPTHMGQDPKESDVKAANVEETDAKITDVAGADANEPTASYTQPNSTDGARGRKGAKVAKKNDKLNNLVWKYSNVSPEEVRALNDNHLYHEKPYMVEIS